MDFFSTSMGAALRCLCNYFCGFDPQLMISQSDVESGLMSRQTAMSGRTAMSEIDQKKVCLPST